MYCEVIIVAKHLEFNWFTGSGRDEIEEREIKSLLGASKETGCNNLLIVTWDYEDEAKIDGKNIKFIPLWKWLLKT